MRKTRRLALTAVLAAIALGIFALEAQLPSPVPIPGVKLGLANVITLTAMLLLGKREAGAVLTVRLLLGALLVGSPSALLYSACGGAFAYAVMCLLVGRVSEKRLWLISAAAGVAHNIGQLLACVLVVKTVGVLSYALILVPTGIITGVFTGLVATYLVRALKKTGN